MLIFHRPEFIRGSIKVKDVKLNDKGEPELQDDGSPVFVYWHLLPDMKGKVIEFNDEKFVKKNYPGLFFSNDGEIELFEMEKRRRRRQRNVKKANEHEVKLKEEFEKGWILERDIESFKKERERFER